MICTSTCAQHSFNYNCSCQGRAQLSKSLFNHIYSISTGDGIGTHTHTHTHRFICKNTHNIYTHVHVYKNIHVCTCIMYIVDASATAAHPLLLSSISSAHFLPTIALCSEIYTFLWVQTMYTVLHVLYMHMCE